jgi:hypothetical protein
MGMQMKYILILSILCSQLSYGKDVEIPDYSVFIQGQFKCDDSSWKKYPWDKRYRDLWRLAYRSVSIVSDVEIIEVPRKNKNKITGPYRNFDLKYTAYARILCGKTSDILNKGKGLFIKENAIIEAAFERKGYLDESTDDEPYAQRTYLEDDPTNFAGGDDPTVYGKGLDGRSCLVKIDDFIKNPLEKINLNLLCKGEDIKKIKKTKNEILRITDILKKAQEQKHK